MAHGTHTRKDLMEHGAIPATGTAHLTPEEAQERLKTLQADLLKVPQGSAQAKALRGEE